MGRRPIPSVIASDATTVDETSENQLTPSLTLPLTLGLNGPKIYVSSLSDFFIMKNSEHAHSVTKRHWIKLTFVIFVSSVMNSEAISVSGRPRSLAIKASFSCLIYFANSLNRNLSTESLPLYSVFVLLEAEAILVALDSFDKFNLNKMSLPHYSHQWICLKFPLTAQSHCKGSRPEQVQGTRLWAMGSTGMFTLVQDRKRNQDRLGSILCWSSSLYLSRSRSRALWVSHRHMCPPHRFDWLIPSVNDVHLTSMQF